MHYYGQELGKQLASRGVPIPVIDGPEIRGTTTYGRERIVVERDTESSDSFGPRHRADVNPRTRMTRLMACKITIYAKATRVGAMYWEHVERVEHVLDQVLCCFDRVATANKNQAALRSGRFFFPPDLDKSETHGGAAYVLYLTLSRGVADRNWDFSADQEITIEEGLIQNTTVAVGPDGTTET